MSTREAGKPLKNTVCNTTAVAFTMTPPRATTTINQPTSSTKSNHCHHLENTKTTNISVQQRQGSLTTLSAIKRNRNNSWLLMYDKVTLLFCVKSCCSFLYLHENYREILYKLQRPLMQVYKYKYNAILGSWVSATKPCQMPFPYSSSQMCV